MKRKEAHITEHHQKFPNKWVKTQSSRQTTQNSMELTNLREARKEVSMQTIMLSSKELMSLHLPLELNIWLQSFKNNRTNYWETDYPKTLREFWVLNLSSSQTLTAELLELLKVWVKDQIKEVHWTMQKETLLQAESARSLSLNYRYLLPTLITKRINKLLVSLSPISHLTCLRVWDTIL